MHARKGVEWSGKMAHPLNLCGWKQRTPPEALALTLTLVFWAKKRTHSEALRWHLEQQWRQSFLPRLSYPHPHPPNIFVFSNQEQTTTSSISLHFHFLPPSPLSLSLLQPQQPEARSFVRLLERMSSMLNTLLKPVKIDS